MHYRNRAIFLICALTLLLGACTSEADRTEPVTTTAGGNPSTAAPAADAKKRDKALVRVINAIPSAGALDLNDDQGKAFSNAAYKQVTPYKELHSEAQTLRLVPMGETNAPPLAQNNEILIAGKHYTVIALQTKDGKNVLRVVNDNLTPPEAGKVKVRVLHTASDVNEVGIYAQGNTKALIDGVNFETATSYTVIDPMTITLEVRPPGQQKAVIIVPNTRFEAGKIYTILITGKANGAPKLEATLIEDHLVAEVTPSPTQTTGGR